MIGSDSNGIGKLNPIRYRGYYYDSETGFYYLSSRYYDPETGRFINADDEGIIDGSNAHILENNLFTYCFNNPVNMRDENGLFPQWLNDLGRGLSDGFVGAFTGMAHSIAHPIETAKSAINGVINDPLGALTSYVVNLVDPFKLGRITYSVATGDFYSTGKLYGDNLAQAATVAASAAVGKVANATYAKVSSVKISKVGRLPADNKSGKGFFGVRYGVKKSSGKYSYKSLELHTPHKSGTHKIWHWQRNQWSLYKGSWTISGKSKYYNILGRRLHR